MKIDKLDKILEVNKQGLLWSFYQNQFAALNEQTPLAQTLSRPYFNSWLTSSRAKKFVVTDDGGEITGFRMLGGKPAPARPPVQAKVLGRFVKRRVLAEGVKGVRRDSRSGAKTHKSLAVPKPVVRVSQNRTRLSPVAEHPHRQ